MAKNFEKLIFGGLHEKQYTCLVGPHDKASGRTAQKTSVLIL
jgi:hypothetical protein